VVHVDSGDDYMSLFEAAGFADVVVEDVTRQYGETLRAWLREWSSRRDLIEPLVGAGEFADRLEARRTGITAVERGTRTRFLITASRPPEARPD